MRLTESICCAKRFGIDGVMKFVGEKKRIDPDYVFEDVAVERVVKNTGFGLVIEDRQIPVVNPSDDEALRVLKEAVLEKIKTIYPGVSNGLDLGPASPGKIPLQPARVTLAANSLSFQDEQGVGDNRVCAREHHGVQVDLSDFGVE